MRHDTNTVRMILVFSWQKPLKIPADRVARSDLLTSKCLPHSCISGLVTLLTTVRGKRPLSSSALSWRVSRPPHLVSS